jgi:dipeptidyl aminopeptidase/acylaminoacyl peptidase
MAWQSPIRSAENPERMQRVVKQSRSTRRAIVAEDLFRIVVVSDPQVAPDGSQVAWVQTVANQDEDTYRSAIWTADVDGMAVRQLTAGTSRDLSPRWSPDGRSIAFLSNRPTALATTESADQPARPLAQVWTISLDGGEAILRTNHPGGVSDPAWAPDARQIAFVGKDKPGEDDPPAPLTKGPIADEMEVRRVAWRGDGKGHLEAYSHIWTVDLGSSESRQITSGDVFDSEPAWSPDGNHLAFTSNRSADRARSWIQSSIQVVSAGGGEVVTIAPEDARFAAPAWSPSGDRIAFRGHLGSDFGRNVHLWSVEFDGTGLTDHTASVDLSFGDSGMSDLHNGCDEGPVWTNEQTLLALASTHGETQVFAVDTRSNSIEPRTSGTHRIAGFAPSGDHLLVVRGTIAQPFELVAWTGNAPQAAISAANAGWLDEVELMDATPLDVTAPDGKAIDAWLIPPYGFTPKSGAKHPLILQVHGGPHSMYGYAMFHEMQLMSAKGYAVVFSNPRGSAGYGEDFMSCTRGAWGEADMPDVIAALEAAVGQPWIDAERLGITGGSYGGYLTNWIIGHDDRFKAAVTQRCVSNLHSFIGTSDIGTTFGIFEFGGTPWHDSGKLLEHSPISYVEAMTTPLLILHSEQDLRCPIEQAEQLFASLKYLDRDVAFVKFPEEGHELSRSGKPGRRLARLHHLIGWFDVHL